MIGSPVKSIPTLFAKLIAESCELYVPDDETRGNEELWQELRDRLSNFQKMAISANFDVSLIAYYGFELDEKQKQCLQIIHQNTKDWLLGHVAEQLLIKLERNSTSGRESAEIAQIITENFTKGKTPSEEVKRGLIVKLANITEEKEEK